MIEASLQATPCMQVMDEHVRLSTYPFKIILIDLIFLCTETMQQSTKGTAVPVAIFDPAAYGLTVVLITM